MPSVFTRIVNGELPARFVWNDDRCVAFLSNRPLRSGHTLVIPREEVDHWLDLEPNLAAHLMVVAQAIGKAQMAAFRPARVGMVIAGLEVPHVHLHVVPMDAMADLDFANADPGPSDAALDQAATALRTALRQMGRQEAVD